MNRSRWLPFDWIVLKAKLNLRLSGCKAGLFILILQAKGGLPLSMLVYLLGNDSLTERQVINTLFTR